jgi:protein gp37
MSDKSAIEWTDATWNPTTGCTKVSPACANCYIERTPPFRIKGRKFVKGHIPLELHMNRLDKPKHWREPRRIFVNSLSDLFHADVPWHFISFVYNTMEATPQHVYQVLTKRADRMREFLDWRYSYVVPPPAHIWHGVSAENQRMLHERGEHLRRTRSAVRFISAEPLLGPLDLMFVLPLLNWVIVGGESGPRVRPMDPDWVRGIRDQCVAARVPFFFKQWGGRTPKSGGRELDGREWNEFPAVEGVEGSAGV